MLDVEIDSHSGFCGGVIRAISAAEQFLDTKGGPLYSLGAIVHNEEELARLCSRGLVTINDLSEVPKALDSHILIRAHGEPPYIYNEIRQKGITLMDCTCPVVLKIQKSIREAYTRLKSENGNLVLYGKKGHPEVLGLVGQVEGDVFVVSNLQELKDLVNSKELSIERSIELFSQTTMSPIGYKQIEDYLRSKMKTCDIICHNTICLQVASRHKQLVQFAHSHDVIIFVTGQQSSNGQVLSQLCRKENPQTYIVSSEKEILKEWFLNAKSVGVCGATSTPKWLLEKVAKVPSSLQE